MLNSLIFNPIMSHDESNLGCYCIGECNCNSFHKLNFIFCDDCCCCGGSCSCNCDDYYKLNFLFCDDCCCCGESCSCNCGSTYKFSMNKFMVNIMNQMEKIVLNIITVYSYSVNVIENIYMIKTYLFKVGDKVVNNAKVPLPTHPYHIVDQSPWPMALSGVLLSLTMSAVLSFHGYPMGDLLFLCSLMLLNWGMSLWFKDMVAEASYLGAHTDKVQKGLSLGVVLFIVSEMFFFLSMFWAYFHSSLAPAIEMGSEWPPKGVEPVNSAEVPSANTTMLLSSGSAVTVTHHSLVDRLMQWANDGSVATVNMAVFFTLLQVMEYFGVSFSITDSVFGSTFYMGTGFHGLHVIMGTLFLSVGAISMFAYQVTNTHHVGVESGILYWHFVDVVWLFLFGAVYFWGGQGQD